MLNIAVDGPSGAGKSTVADEIAKRLNILHLNTGALYRAIGLYMIQHNINARDEKLVENILGDINVDVKYENGEQKTILNGIDVTGYIYSMEVSDISSITSAYPLVREKILLLQRKIANENSCIMEGRDITSHVLPNADYKLYIDASPEVRAKRRMDDAKNSDENLEYEKVLADIIERDRRDKERTICPLVIVDDAIYIKTDNMSIEEVVNKIMSIIEVSK